MSKKPRRFDLSITQIVASVLASVSAATAAARLGVAGTIVGAAVVSAIATTASAVYGHSLRETNARLRRTIARQQGDVRDSGGAGTIVQLAADSDAVEPSARVAASDDTLIMEPLGSFDERHALAGPAVPHRQPYHWWAMAGSVVLVFGVAIGLITAIELGAGRPLDGIVGGSTGGGTTIEHAVTGGGHHGRTSPTPSTPTLTMAPTVTKTPVQPTTSAEAEAPSASPTPPEEPTPTPDPTATGSPTPTSAPTTPVEMVTPNG